MVNKRGIFSSTTNKSNSKKGQVTVFIIIGIILVFVTAGIIFVTQSATEAGLTASGDPIIEDAPQEFRPLQQFVEGCVEDTAKKGLITLGEQGGYINPTGTFSASTPTESDGLNLEPLKVPYWHYNSKPSSASTVVFTSKQPKLYAKEDPDFSIEVQLADYVEANLDSCYSAFDSFKSQGFIVESNKIDGVTVKVATDTVNFWVKQDISAEKGGARHEMNQYFIKVPLRLKHFYEVASDLTEQELNQQYLENIGLNNLQTYSQADSSKLPPTNTFTFAAVSTNSWSTPLVKEDIKNMLTSTVPLIRYQSSVDFYRFEYPQSDNQPLIQKSYDNMILPITKAKDVEISFDYYGWEPYLDINEGEKIIEPENNIIKSPLPVIPFNFNFQRYYNTYDLSYPVLVSIRDSKALGGTGYTFNFALESNIVNNAAAVADYVQPPIIQSLNPSMVCDKNKRNTQLVRTIVVDSFTKEPLDLVKIGFDVPNQDYCEIGETNTQGTLDAKYPAVYGGNIELVKSNYLSGVISVNTYDFKDQEAIIGYAVQGLSQPVIELHQLHDINVRVQKKSFEKCVTNEDGDETCFSQGLFSEKSEKQISYKPEMLDETHAWSFVNFGKNLLEDEEASIILKRVSGLNNNLIEDEFTIVVTVQGNNPTRLTIVPGVYEVTGYLIDKAGIYIAESERCSSGVLEAIACVDLDGCCVTFPDTELNEFVVGRVSWNTPKTYIVITPEQLYTSQEIIITLPSLNLQGVPLNERITEDLQQVEKVAEVSNTPVLRKALDITFK
ncbi:hypothetical protein HQ489_02825 [Candidatus Woesearchaeota archaeon]|nr:hypothetical protein [Candidatus Woesearchaeota archaeon]